MNISYKNFLKRTLSMLLCLCVLMSLASVSFVSASETTALAAQNTLYFDADSEVFTMYSGGSPSTVMEYDCGNAVKDDGSKSYLRIIQNTTDSEYLSYIEKLSNKGFTAVMYNKTVAADSGYNRFSSFISPEGNYKVYTYYFPYYKETRIIVDTEADTVAGFNYTSETGQSVEPLICMYGLSMSENGYDITTTTEYSTGKRNCGALMVIRMPDNSLFFHDGGDIEQWDDQACDDFLKFCRNLTGVPEGEKMVVNAWHISHAHTDHYLGFPRFFSRHHSEFDLKNIIYNIDIERTYTTRDMYQVVRMVSSYYPDVKYYKPHTGESFNIAGVDFDVIYSVEDRYLPNENGEIITDYPTIVNGKPVSAYDLGGTYREFCYEADGKSDFNDTSSVFKVTFTKGSEKVDSILYADMNLAEQILWDIYPDSFLETDMMMIPHHGFDSHPELCTMSKADIFFFTQHRGAIYGADGDLSTKDGAGLYRSALYKNYLEMQSGIETPGSKTYWQGNETAIVSPFGVKVDIPETTEDTECPDGYAVYLMDVRAFVYEGWSVDGSDNIISGSDFTTELNSVETVTNNYVYSRVDYPAYNGRYVVVHNNSDKIMHYTATTPLNEAVSLNCDQDGNKADVFHYALNSDGSVNKDYLYFDHSNRDGVLWIVKQTKKASYGTDAITDGQELSYTSNDKPVTVYLGAEKRYHHTQVNKGIGPVFAEDGTISAVKNGAYWYSVEGADAEGVQERYINFFETQAEMYSIDSTTTQFESFSDGTFVIYRKDGDLFHVLCCDETTGNWYSEALTVDEVADRLDSLKVRLYKYGGDEGNKSVALQGPQTFNVVEGIADINVLERIPRELIVCDTTNNLLHVPSSGTEGKIGYYWIKFESKFDSSKKRTSDDYQVGVYYRNDNATDTKIGEVTVHVQSDILIDGTSEITVKNGAILKNSASDSVIRSGLSEDASECSFTTQVNTINGLVTRTVPVTLDMLTDAQGNPVDVSQRGVYSDLTLTYEGQIICTDFTLRVYENYSVVFKDYDGTVLSTQTVTEGDSATAPDVPERAEDVNYVYSFKEWDKDYTNISADTIITAVWNETPQVYYLRGTFNDWQAQDEMTKNEDGTYTFVVTLDAGKYEYKAANDSYSMEWPLGSNKTLDLQKESVVTFTLDTVNNTIEATYVTVQKSYTVTFLNYDGSVISTQTVFEGESAETPDAPTRPADVNYIYTFKSWDKDFSNVTEDIEVTATYTETPQTYYIRGSFNDWKAQDVMTKEEDGTYTFVITLDAGYYEYKAANDDYSMQWPLGNNKTLTLEKESIVTFKLDTVNHTILAFGEEVTHEYSVIFKNWDGYIISNQTVLEGESAVAPENPYKAADVNFRYTFAGWDKDFSNITEDTVITATYTETPQVYYLRGSFNGWQAKDVMTKNEDGTYSIVMTLPAGDHEYKAANDDYSMEWPLGNNKTLSLQKESLVTFTLNTTDNTIEAKAEVIIKYYTVVFKDYDGTVLSTQTVLEDSAAVAPSDPTRESSAKYSYTFSGWDKSFDVITADTVITATYNEVINKYVVSFVDYDGRLISSQSVEYGSAAKEPAAPSREADEQCSYTFIGWDKDFSNITSDLTVKAQYSVTYHKYTVTFYDYDGRELSSQIVVHGTSAVSPEDPERAETYDYVYSFAGWDKSFSSITGDTEIYATYTQSPQVYYIKGSFNDWQTTDAMTKLSDGIYTYSVTLDAGEYAYMASNISESKQWPAEATQTVTTERESFVTFTLNAKDNLLTASVNSLYKEFTVVFRDYDGTVISTQTVIEGEDAVVPEYPTRPSDAKYTYIFAYWDGNYENVNSDLVITAKYVEIVNKYIVTFVDDNGVLISTQSVKYGESAEAPAHPEKDGYTFIGWDKTFDSITTDTIITALYEKDVVTYIVTFVDFDGRVISTQTISEGEGAEAPESPSRAADVEYIYTFAGWDKDFSNITADTTVTAQYDKADQVYYLRGGFNNWSTSDAMIKGENGIYTAVFTLEAGDYEYKAANENYSMEWPLGTNQTLSLTEKSVVTFTLDTINHTLTASAESVIVKFKVTFVDFDGTVISTQNVVSGESAAVPEAPEREGYIFTGWSDEANEVTEDMIIVALYEKEIIIVEKYMVIFVDDEGMFISSQIVAEGDKATAPNAPQKDGYEFIGWDTDFTNVTQDITVKAIYEKTETEEPEKPDTPEAVTIGNLRVEVAGGTSFTISVNGGAERTQGTSYINSKAPVGVSVTVVAKTTNGNAFVGWMNGEGLILSTNLTYTFTTTGNDYLKAMYQTEIEESTLVVFKNDKANQILDMQYYVEGDEIVFPEYPVNAAWEVTGWSMSAEEIAEAIKSGKTVTVTPTWTKILTYVSVTVNGGTATGVTDGKTLKFGAVTVTAEKAATGKKFAYWVDAEGKVQSYSSTYTFYPANDIELTAVYVDSNADIDYEIILNINMDTTNESTDVNTVILSWEVAEDSDYTFVQAGALIVEGSKYNADTFYKGTTDSNVTRWTPGSANQIPTKTITVNKKGVAAGSTWIVQGWITYIDAKGTQQTIYTDLVYVTK